MEGNDLMNVAMLSVLMYIAITLKQLKEAFDIMSYKYNRDRVPQVEDKNII